MKMSNNFKRIAKKIFVIVLVVGLGAYVSWDVSKKIIGKLRDQGREATIMEIITFSENEKCEPFSIFIEGKEVSLINIDCLQKISEEELLTEELDSSNVLEIEETNN